MRNNRGVIRACFYFLVLVAGLATTRATDGIEEVKVSGKALDEALAGKQTYNYVIVTADEIVDTEGRHFSPKKAKAYLKKAKPDKKAAFVFWLPDDDAVAIAKGAIGHFSDYGATVFVVRKIEHNEKPPVAVPAAPGEPPKQVMLVGRPNPKAQAAGDPVPDMGGRPAHLRPGKLPGRVRFKYAPDADVVAAAERTAGLLLADGPLENVAGYHDLFLVQAGAWQHLSGLTELAASKPLVARVELKGGVQKLEGRIVDQPGQFAAVVARLRTLIAADGGGSVRALSTAEMNHWWTFISLDIEEPVFIVETKGGRYRFVVAWNRDHVFCFDELRALPPS